jgi:hypothetical protein
MISADFFEQSVGDDGGYDGFGDDSGGGDGTSVARSNLDWTASSVARGVLNDQTAQWLRRFDTGRTSDARSRDFPRTSGLVNGGRSELTILPTLSSNHPA